MNILSIGFAIVFPIFMILTIIKILLDDLWDTDWIDVARFSLVTIVFMILPLAALASVQNTQDEVKASIVEASAEIETVTCESTVAVEPTESAKTNTENDKRLDEIEYHADKTDDALNELNRKVEENTKRLDRIEEITEQYSPSDKKFEIKDDGRGVPQKMFEGIDRIIFGEHENE